MQTIDTEPWWKQGWPWFLISLPASVIVASAITYYVIVKYPDDETVQGAHKVGLVTTKLPTAATTPASTAIPASPASHSLP